jgi:lysozyme
VVLEEIQCLEGQVNPILRNRLLAAATAGAIGIAAALAGWYEGTGPTVKQSDGSMLYEPYKDPAGIWTVCRGVTGADVVLAKRYTEAECATLEHKHLALAERDAKNLLRRYDNYSIWRKAALIDYTYNVGAGNLARSTMTRRFNAGDETGGCDELLKWVKGHVKGQLVTLRGLVDRRGAERELCLERV